METIENKILKFNPEKKKANDSEKDAQKILFGENEPTKGHDNVITFHESVRLRQLDKKFAKLGETYKMIRRRFEYKEERPPELFEKIAAFDIELGNFLEEIEKIWSEIELEHLDLTYELNNEADINLKRKREIRKELREKRADIDVLENAAHVIQ